MIDNAYREIVRTYFRRRRMWVAWAIWGFCCVLLVCLILEDRLPRNPEKPIANALGFLFLIGWLFGSHITSQMVHSHFSRLPDAPRKNLVAGSVMMGTFCIGLPTLAAWLGGASAWGTMSVCLAVSGMGLVLSTWDCHGVLLGLTTFPFVFLLIQHTDLSPVVGGEAPITTTVVSLIGLVAFGVANYRLMHLNDLEADFVYNKMRANWEVKREDAESRGCRTRWGGLATWTQRQGSLERPIGRVPSTLLARVRLWQLGSGLPRPWSFGIMVAAMAGGLRIVMQLKLGNATAAELNHNTIHLAATVSMLTPMWFFGTMRQRMRCFDVDSLKPTSRRRFVLENGLATALDCLAAWLTMGVLLAVATKLLCPRLLQPDIVGGYVLRAICVQTFFFGVAAWLFAARSFWARLVLLSSGFAVLVAVFLSLGHNVPVLSATTASTTLLGVVGAVLIVIAYRRWCNLEMARDGHWLSM